MTKGQPLDTHIHLDHEPEINRLFQAAIKTGASDIHLKVGLVPKLRIQRVLKNTTGEIITKESAQRLIFEILSEDQKEFFLDNGVLDFAWQVGEDNRFRVNIFRQRGFISLVARHITSNIPQFESLHLPEVIKKIAENHDGLVLVTGPTGCGKSTTIASMIDHINNTRPCHIVTIEDPIEYLYRDQKAIISQREIGIDVPDFESALKTLMRQDPDVVLIGEIRDGETLTASMRAAETGHLVFGTLHSINPAQTIQRLLDLFGQQERDLARQSLALTIRAIISQNLMPGLKPEAMLMPAVEILTTSPIVRKLISEKREAELSDVIRASQNEGMQDFTESLRKLIMEDWVELKVALQHAPNVEELRMAIKGIRGSTSGIL